MKTKRIVWTVVFLGVTLAAIVMEVVAAVWHPAGTIPWTEYIAQYVPWPVQLAAYVALAVWLPFHFWRHDHIRTASFKEGFAVGKTVGYNNGRQDADRLRRGNRPAGTTPPSGALLLPTEKV